MFFHVGIVVAASEFGGWAFHVLTLAGVVWLLPEVAPGLPSWL